MSQRAPVGVLLCELVAVLRRPAGRGSLDERCDFGPGTRIWNEDSVEADGRKAARGSRRFSFGAMTLKVYATSNLSSRACIVGRSYGQL